MLPEDGPLRAPFRAIRAVRAPDDAPWPGVLARTADGTSVVLVDAQSLGPGWRGWTAAPDGHVLAPRDIARRTDGHDVVLPVCLERLDDFLRRRAARTPVTAGEAVTLGVSILRGCMQIVGAPPVTGEWWLDGDGRPVLATDASTRGAFDGAAAALEAADDAARSHEAWRAVIRAVRAERVSLRELVEAEDALFALADPEPLATTTLSPRSVADLPAKGERRDAASAVAEPPSRSIWIDLAARVDADLADTVSRVTTAVWRRARRPTGSRRAPWVVGGAVAAAIVAGGALWPTASGVATGDGAASGSDPDSSSYAAPDDVGGPAEASNAGEEPRAQEVGATPAPVSSEPPAPIDSGGLAAVAGALLDARLDCAGDGACLENVLADPAAALPRGVIDLPPADRTTVMLDDFGGVAVMRVDGPVGTPAQLAVIVLRDDEWLLRDVHDVAQQP